MKNPIGLLLVLGVWAGVAFCGDARAEDPPSGDPETIEQIEVERVKEPRTKLSSLRFLRENRDFLRAQLDRLRMSVKLREGEARMLSDRDLRLQDLMAALTAAWDSLAVEEDRLSQRDLLRSIAELGELEAQLDRIETLLRDQRGRLGEIEADYVGRQETAVALLVTGLPAGETAALLVDDADGETLRVPLDPVQRAALRRGAVAQLFHDFVEPRPTSLHLRAELPDGRELPLGVVRLTPARDRLTFVQLDLSSLDTSAADAVERELSPTVWER